MIHTEEEERHDLAPLAPHTIILQDANKLHPRWQARRTFKGQDASHEPGVVESRSLPGNR